VALDVGVPAVGRRFGSCEKTVSVKNRLRELRSEREWSHGFPGKPSTRSRPGATIPDCHWHSESPASSGVGSKRSSSPTHDPSRNMGRRVGVGAAAHSYPGAL
jgi:hypothetical protein